MSRALAGSRSAFVASETAVDDAGVIKHRTNPGRGDMAGITRCRCRNMVRILADGDDAVMTGFAGTVDLRMIHRGYRYPT